MELSRGSEGGSRREAAITKGRGGSNPRSLGVILLVCFRLLHLHLIASPLFFFHLKNIFHLAIRLASSWRPLMSATCWICPPPRASPDLTRSRKSSRRDRVCPSTTRKNKANLPQRASLENCTRFSANAPLRSPSTRTDTRGDQNG